MESALTEAKSTLQENRDGFAGQIAAAEKKINAGEGGTNHTEKQV